MADFCYDCLPKTFGDDIARDMNDMIHDESEPQFDVCEGCGPGWFDDAGRRAATTEQEHTR